MKKSSSAAGRFPPSPSTVRKKPEDHETFSCGVWQQERLSAAVVGGKNLGQLFDSPLTGAARALPSEYDPEICSPSARLDFALSARSGDSFQVEPFWADASSSEESMVSPSRPRSSSLGRLDEMEDQTPHLARASAAGGSPGGTSQRSGILEPVPPFHHIAGRGGFRGSPVSPPLRDMKRRKLDVSADKRQFDATAAVARFRRSSDSASPDDSLYRGVNRSWSGGWNSTRERGYVGQSSVAAAAGSSRKLNNSALNSSALKNSALHSPADEDKGSLEEAEVLAEGLTAGGVLERSFKQTSKNPSFRAMNFSSKDVNRSFHGVNRSFDGVNRSFDGVNRSFDGVNRSFDGVNRSFDAANRSIGADKGRRGVVLAGTTVKGSGKKPQLSSFLEEMRAKKEADEKKAASAVPINYRRLGSYQVGGSASSQNGVYPPRGSEGSPLLMNRSLFDESGFDRDGLDRSGYDQNGLDKNGFDREGIDQRSLEHSSLMKSSFLQDHSSFLQDHSSFMKSSPLRAPPPGGPLRAPPRPADIACPPRSSVPTRARGVLSAQTSRDAIIAGAESTGGWIPVQGSRQDDEGREIAEDVDHEEGHDGLDGAGAAQFPETAIPSSAEQATFKETHRPEEERRPPLSPHGLAAKAVFREKGGLSHEAEFSNVAEVSFHDEDPRRERPPPPARKVFRSVSVNFRPPEGGGYYADAQRLVPPDVHTEEPKTGILKGGKRWRKRSNHGRRVSWYYPVDCVLIQADPQLDTESWPEWRKCLKGPGCNSIGSGIDCRALDWSAEAIAEREARWREHTDQILAKVGSLCPRLVGRLAYFMKACQTPEQTLLATTVSVSDFGTTFKVEKKYDFGTIP